MTTTVTRLLGNALRETDADRLMRERRIRASGFDGDASRRIADYIYSQLGLGQAPGA
jgi:hypothetical protein